MTQHLKSSAQNRCPVPSTHILSILPRFLLPKQVTWLNPTHVGQGHEFHPLQGEALLRHLMTGPECILTQGRREEMEGRVWSSAVLKTKPQPDSSLVTRILPVLNYLQAFVRASLPASSVFLIPLPYLNMEHLSGLVQTLTSSAKSSLTLSAYRDLLPL